MIVPSVPMPEGWEPPHMGMDTPVGFVRDQWADLGTYCCETCRFFVPKTGDSGKPLGRCRRHAPTMDGYPVVYMDDWCGDHKLGTNPSRS